MFLAARGATHQQPVHASTSTDRTVTSYNTTFVGMFQALFFGNQRVNENRSCMTRILYLIGQNEPLDKWIVSASSIGIIRNWDSRCVLSTIAAEIHCLSSWVMTTTPWNNCKLSAATCVDVRVSKRSCLIWWVIMSLIRNASHLSTYPIRNNNDQ